MKEDLFELLLRLADDHLILGHRVSEWCGHAPMLEEDLALPNIALDLIGQSRALYTYAGEIEGRGRDEDQLAYLRLEREYRNVLLVERPNGDFAHTIARQLFFSVYMQAWWREAVGSADETLAAIAAKAVKEADYHVRHAAEWTIRLGDGTQESSRRMAAAVDALWSYTGELFETDSVTDALAGAGVAPDPAMLKAGWERVIAEVFTEATLDVPDAQAWQQTGGRRGRHGEEMGYLLADLQYIQRAYPGMTW
ncbi:1,2-phenylacetyl-CoA epoxidase subunit PaaC [Oricola indica]|jgi:ring-1,2-phenylacetyl-CoA epoxidase subunit PaaC|uniref:1,2-phenylacetyl-CoA epoxidase subunit PaaC n=1 Tax=Oricola indica TaxID=2872591 RepID=UPI001CBAF0E9|nr:1,2-phenylacetyl-CoA epoxidase subunit PaaC [Oricola indica]